MTAQSERDPEPDPDQPSEGYRSLKTFGRFGAVGVEMAVFLIIGVKAGQWLDRRMGTEYWVLVGLALGIATGFRSLLLLARRPTPRPTPELGREADPAEVDGGTDSSSSAKHSSTPPSS